MKNRILRNKKILRRENTALLIIDVQARILNAIPNKEALTRNILKLIEGVKILNIPIYYVEQYPEGLGRTVPEIKEALINLNPIGKMSFSCSGANNLFHEFNKKGITQILVCGIESHVCVQQTVLDLISNNFQVDVVADAVSSRKKEDYEFALDRMRSNGAEITTIEAILFELLGVCGTDEFRTVCTLLK